MEQTKRSTGRNFLVFWLMKANRWRVIGWPLFGLLMVGGCKPTLQPAGDKLPFSAVAPSSDISSKVLAANAGLAGRVEQALSAEPQLRDLTFGVQISNLTRKLTLTGTVERQSQVNLAVKTAQSIVGKVKVINHLTLTSTSARSGRRLKGEAGRMLHP